MGVFSLIVYSAFMYGIYVPDWHFTIHNKDSADYGKVTCRVRGKLDPPCNAVGLIDRSVLGINQMYQHPTWRRSKGHSNRLKDWVIMGLFFLVLGLILHFTHAIPLNKQLYTFSYVCVTLGTTALVFTTIYNLFVKDLHALISPVPQGTPLPLVLLGKSKNALLLTFLFLNQIVWLGRTSIYKLRELGRLSVSMEKLEEELKNGDKCQVCLT
ncbi:hypothetical protein SLEP1_g4024 [Rubroshorea leprosula]|uniref:Uncharacterized protein n=1 Tax=Rubroshorea leprosula TaxID=152421 RepID=A0AAV5HUY0_9ROSI|nr:hypothetical protein SLEP1_g4024 [Rubroshorea leprosula]